MTRHMKDSGVEWIGEIPEDWEVVKAKRKFKTNKVIVGEKYNEFNRLSLTLNGVLKRPSDDNKGLQPQNLRTYQILNEKDLIFKLIDLENVKTSRVGYSNYQGLVSPVYIRLINPNETRFGYYYYMNMWYQEIFNALGAGVRSSLSATDLLNIPYIFIPNIKEKHDIVEFLDKKINQINSIISDTQQSIIELKKYKQSLITETVTKGLDKTVEMKDSRIEWIGDVPENWFLIKLKYLVQIDPSKTTCINLPEYATFLPMNKVKNGYMITDEFERTDNLKNKYTYFAKNDIVIAKVRPSFENGNISIAENLKNDIGFGTSEIFVLRVSDAKLKREFLKYYLQNLNFIKNGSYSMTGVAGLKRISSSFINNYYIGLPSLEEQQQIVDFLDNKTSKIDSLISDKEKMITEYEAYKKSLIYEYVTGKKQV